MKEELKCEQLVMVQTYSRHSQGISNISFLQRDEFISTFPGHLVTVTVMLTKANLQLTVGKNDLL